MADDFSTWLIDNPEPSLAELIQLHGGYAAVPPDAWADFDRRMAAWQRLRRERYGGAIDNQFAKALSKLRDDVARRAGAFRPNQRKRNVL
jgi:hypothetical protein